MSSTISGQNRCVWQSIRSVGAAGWAAREGLCADAGTEDMKTGGGPYGDDAVSPAFPCIG